MHYGFYGLKLHVASNHHGELPSMKVTPGNVDDRKPVAFLCRSLFGRIYADKGYVARWLVDLLRARQLDLITRMRTAQESFDSADCPDLVGHCL
jgi:hypothetical protein